MSLTVDSSDLTSSSIGLGQVLARAVELYCDGLDQRWVGELPVDMRFVGVTCTSSGPKLVLLFVSRSAPESLRGYSTSWLPTTARELAAFGSIEDALFESTFELWERMSSHTDSWIRDDTGIEWLEGCGPEDT